MIEIGRAVYLENVTGFSAEHGVPGWAARAFAWRGGALNYSDFANLANGCHPERRWPQRSLRSSGSN